MSLQSERSSASKVLQTPARRMVATLERLGTFSRSTRGQSTAFTIFSIIVLLVGVIISLLTPPFTNPDEGAHYLRSYEVSRGHLVNGKNDVGVPIPCDEYKIVASKYAPIAFYQDVDTLHGEAHAEGCTVQSINSAGVYPPISYFASALGIRVAEAVKASPEDKLRTARVINYLVSTGLILMALASIRHYRLLLCALVLMPTTVWQRASLTADSLTLSFCVLFVCTLIKLLEAQEPPRKWQIAWLGVLGVLLGSTKLVYSVLAFSSLILLWKRPARTSSPAWSIILLLPGILGMGAALVWLKLPDSSLFYLGNGAQPQQQLLYCLTHPWAFLETLYRTMANPGHALSFVAGGFPTEIGATMATAYTIILAALVMTSRSLFTLKQRGILLLVSLGACAAAVLPMYLTYTPPGHTEILGIQGRYFIPIAIFALVGTGFARERWLFMSRPLRAAVGLVAPLLILAYLIDFRV
ncbi:hypothetical protein D3C72_479600 [compost metagenome]